MAAETAPIRDKTRRVKDLALSRAQEVLEHPKKYSEDVYNQTYLTVLKNAVPRTQLLAGDEDLPPVSVQITGMKIIKDPLSGDSIQDKKPKAD